MSPFPLRSLASRSCSVTHHGLLFNSKFVDSHLKPYKCKHENCENSRFSSTACLLRHEREGHLMQSPFRRNEFSPTHRSTVDPDQRHRLGVHVGNDLVQSQDRRAGERPFDHPAHRRANVRAAQQDHARTRGERGEGLLLVLDSRFHVQEMLFLASCTYNEVIRRAG